MRVHKYSTILLHASQTTYVTHELVLFLGPHVRLGPLYAVLRAFGLFRRSFLSRYHAPPPGMCNGMDYSFRYRYRGNNLEVAWYIYRVNSVHTFEVLHKKWQCSRCRRIYREVIFYLVDSDEGTFVTIDRYRTYSLPHDSDESAGTCSGDDSV